MFQSSGDGPLKGVQKPAAPTATAIPPPTSDQAAPPSTTGPPTTDEPRGGFMNRQPLVFDGKRMRKAVIRKTIDYNSCVIKYLENRKWFKNLNSKHGIQPDEAYAAEILPPKCMPDNPINAVTTKFVRTSTNKLRCPIFCVVWTPEGRRLVTGASSGEFTLWNGLTFNFETILTAHDSPVRSMVWNHHDSWLLSADHSGVVKYWQSNMNNVQMYEAHKEPVRGLSFSPTDNKYASCADDGLVKIWDFYRCTEEKILRGHGADVKCIDWHPHKSLLVSGSKDSQQPIKLWDTRTGNGLATLHLHKNTVMSIKWNQNGNWLLTASRDHLLKLYDIRAMKEIQAFRGHKREATAIAWHPIHENLFASGGSDGSIMFWTAGTEKDVGNMESAHEGMVWSIAWHPLGHILCSGSNDHTSKFWTRNRLGDRMRDRYNLNMQDTEDDMGDDVAGAVRGFSVHHTTAIPGMDTTFSASDPDFMDTHVGLPDFGSPPKSHLIKSTQSRSRVNENFTLPGFSSQPPRPGAFAPANASNQPPPAKFGQNDSGPRFGSLRPDAPPFQPRGGGQPRFQQPGPPNKMQGGRPIKQEEPWQPNQPGPPGPDNRMQPRPGGPPFRNNPGQDRQFPPRGGPDQFGPNGHPDREPRQGPDFRGRQDDQRHGPGFEEPWPPRDQGRGPQKDGWGPSDPRRGHDRGPPDSRRGPPNDPRRPPPDDNRRGEVPMDYPPQDQGPRGFVQDRKAGILGPVPLGPDGQPIGPPGPDDHDPRGPPGERGDRMEQPRGGHPFQAKPSSRGFRQGAMGHGPSREPRDQRGPAEDQFGMPPGDRGPMDRPPFDRDPWGEQPPEHEFRGPPHLMDQDRRGPRDPRGPAPPRDPNGPLDRRQSNDPPRPPDGPKPLMSLLSLAPIAPPPGAERDLDALGLQRKRPGDDRQQEFDRGPRDQRNRDPRDLRDRADPHDRDPRQRDPRSNRDWGKEGPFHDDSNRGPLPAKVMREDEEWRFGPPPPGHPENRRDNRGEPAFGPPPPGQQENRRDSRGEPAFGPPPPGHKENRRDNRGEPPFGPPPPGHPEIRRDSRGEQPFGPPPPGQQENRRDNRGEPPFGPAPPGQKENRRDNKGEPPFGPPPPGHPENRRDNRGELPFGPPPPGPPNDRNNGRGEQSFAEDLWDDVSWNKNDDQLQGSWR